jgi:hypothetical protein
VLHDRVVAVLGVLYPPQVSLWGSEESGVLTRDLSVCWLQSTGDTWGGSHGVDAQVRRTRAV